MAKARKKSQPAKKASKAPKNQAKSTKPRLSSILLTMDEAGSLLGISAERVRQLVKEGYVSKPAKNAVPLKSAVEGYIRFLKDDARRSSKSAAASRVQDARARQMEVRTAREINELIPAEEANAFLQTVIGTFVSLLTGVPAQVTRDLDERRKIEAALDGVRAEVAKTIEEFGADYADIGDLGETDTEGASGSVGEGK